MTARVQRASLEAMQLRELLRWARTVRGYHIHNARGLTKDRLIDLILQLEHQRLQREQATPCPS